MQLHADSQMFNMGGSHHGNFYDEDEVKIEEFESKEETVVYPTSPAQHPIEEIDQNDHKTEIEKFEKSETAMETNEETVKTEVPELEPKSE
jgi:hypothetical protein